jgi:hypothetical protein
VVLDRLLLVAVLTVSDDVVALVLDRVSEVSVTPETVVLVCEDIVAEVELRVVAVVSEVAVVAEVVVLVSLEAVQVDNEVVALEPVLVEAGFVLLVAVVDVKIGGTVLGGTVLGAGVRRSLHPQHMRFAVKSVSS